MDTSVLPAIILFIAGLCCLGTGIAAFRRYSVTQSERLFVVGVAMAIAAVGIVCGALDSISALRAYALEWPWYFGTSVGYLLLFLSSIMQSNEQFCMLKRWSIIAGAVVITMIALSMILPDVSQDRNVTILINALRAVICSLGFFRYLILYTSKGTRFSLLMCLTFLFLMVGYAIIIPQVLDPASWQLPLVDQLIRMAGDVLLFTAFILG
jgi:hypothetical protein